MECMALHLEAAFERLYRWAQGMLIIPEASGGLELVKGFVNRDEQKFILRVKH